MKHLTPKEITENLDQYVVGQEEAKKSVAIALRNRFRRRSLPKHQQEDITPKNILMIGPTGVGKTEIARRLAKLDDSPFIKVEATKFTEVGYVGRDVEQIIRDLLEISIYQISERLKKETIGSATQIASKKIIDILCGSGASDETKEKFAIKLASGELDNKTIEIELKNKPKNNFFDPGALANGQINMINLSNILGGGEHTTKKTLTVKEAFRTLIDQESENLLDKEKINDLAIESVENNGIVFLDEIDKIANPIETNRGHSGSVSREGVQRDLLPLVEGTMVQTKYGSVKTDHILFIASGAFHISKPSDLLPELQGRFPIRVELKPLNEEHLVKILTEPKNNLIHQYSLLMSTEKVKLVFKKEAIQEIASLAFELNNSIENIGARRLQTILEKTLEDISFEASEKADTTFTVTKSLVNSKVANIVKKQDLSRFIL